MAESWTWQALRPVYDERASQYVSPRASGALEYYARHLRKFQALTKLLEEFLPTSGLILDAGTGDGRYAAWLTRRGYQVVATDISTVMLDVARRFVVENADVGLSRLLVGNLEGLPLRAESFDAIVCAQVLEHLLDDDAGLRELARLLKRDGQLFLTTDNADNRISSALKCPTDALKSLLGVVRYRFPFPHKAYAMSALTEKVERAGLRVVYVETARWSLPSPLQRIKLLSRCVDWIETLMVARCGLLKMWGDIIQVVAIRADAPPAPVAGLASMPAASPRVSGEEHRK